MNCVAEIAKRIENRIPVALYAVGTNMAMLLNELKMKHNVSPSVLCDKDINKHGKKYTALYNIEIMPVEQALEKYPELEVFVASSVYKHQIIGELTEDGKIPKERIINYVPVEKRKSCRFIENRMLYMFDGDLKPCVCRDSPHLKNYSFGDAEKYMALKESTIESISTDSKDIICHGCKAIQEDWYPVNRILSYVNYCAWNTCNLKCIYCFGIGMGAPDLKEKSEIGFGEFMKPYLENGWLDDNYEAVLSTVGEPTLHPKRKEFYDAFNGYAMTINTNGTVFDEYLFELMNEKKVFVQISLDAGTKETFAKVKGVDCFEKVIGNIKKYSKAKIGIVMLKYIFLPDINDSDEDIKGFLEVIDKTGVDCVNLAIAFESSHRVGHDSQMRITDYSLEQMRKLKNEIDRRNKFCFLNTTQETEDLIDVLNQRVR